LLFSVLAVLVDPREIFDRVRHLRPAWVGAALGVTVLQVVASGWRWRFTASRLSIDLPLKRAVSEYYLATFLNQVLPGGVLGDVSRAWRHARSEDTTLPAVHAVLLERLSGLVVMASVAVISGLLLARTAAFTTAVLLVVAVGAAYAVRRVTRFPAFEQFARHARLAFLEGSALPIQLATSGLVVASYLVVFLMAARSVGIETPATLLLLLAGPVLMTMLVPVTVAGWGLREGAAAALWSVLGLTAADGVVISVSYGLLVLVSSLPGAVLVVATLWSDRDPGRRARLRPEGTDVPEA
jgi:uncharacterized membrane protein YbhN (UPF0104 family)